MEPRPKSWVSSVRSSSRGALEGSNPFKDGRDPLAPVGREDDRGCALPVPRHLEETPDQDFDVLGRALGIARAWMPDHTVFGLDTSRVLRVDGSTLQMFGPSAYTGWRVEAAFGLPVTHVIAKPEPTLR